MESMEEIAWMGAGVEELGRLSNGEVVQMLTDSIWRAVKESWAAQAEQHTKLKVVREMRKSQRNTSACGTCPFKGRLFI